MRIKDKIEFDVKFLHQTSMAVLVNYDGKEYWVPDSQIDEDSEVYAGCKLERGEAATLVCSEWLATERGMV